MNRKTNAGFTLIEVMITVAIIGILAAVAIPSYQNYIRRGQLQEAFMQLADYSAKMEQYYLDNKNYGNTTGTTCATASSANSWNAFAPGGVQYFSFGCALGNSGQSYVVTATGTSGLTTGYNYTIDQDGDRMTVRYAGNTVSQACWLSSGTAC